MLTLITCWCFPLFLHCQWRGTHFSSRAPHAPSTSFPSYLANSWSNTQPLRHIYDISYCTDHGVPIDNPPAQRNLGGCSCIFLVHIFPSCLCCGISDSML
ncbi:uncharacterized protein EDB91DRAFT_1145840, partial [Suillus paluster]|uniref:uncharacterized protein n=1 Tax=Suillus paluster TaxID=48578 RepID=UPI001B86DCD4